MELCGFVLDLSGLPGVPPATSIRSRTTFDMHTHELLADHGYVDGTSTGDSYDSDPFSSGPRDTVTYFYYEASVAESVNWIPGATGCIPPPPPSPYPRGTSVPKRRRRQPHSS